MRARVLLHAGLRIEAARIVMEMEEDISEEMLQAEVRALSEKPNTAVALNLDDELMRLLKGPGYSLARRSLGIDASSHLETSRCSAPSGDSGTRFLHSSGFTDSPARLSRIHIAVLSLHASLKAATAAAAEESSSETASLHCLSSSWSVSSVSDAEVAAHDWVVDDNIADNVFRLRDTLSSRMFMRTQKRSEAVPSSGGDAELQSGFGVIADLGGMIFHGGLGQKGIEQDNSNSNGVVGKGDKSEGKVSDVAGSFGDIFNGAVNKISSGIGAGNPPHAHAPTLHPRTTSGAMPVAFARKYHHTSLTSPVTVADGARLMSLPSLSAFSFPNFPGSSDAASLSGDGSALADPLVAPVAPCGFDRKQIEEVRH